MKKEMAMSRAKKTNSDAKVSLEDYLLLLHSRSHLNLTVSHLNQIIHMHGYKKIHKVHKKLLSDAVNSLQLVNPCRSTLQDYISPLVTLKKEHVIADLTDLNWQECCISSVQTLSRSSNNNQYQPPPPPPRNDAVQLQQYSTPAASDSAAYSVVFNALAAPSKKRSVRKRRRTAKLADLVNFSLA